MTPLQSATQAAESYLQSQRALEGLPAADILAELVITAYEAARTANVSGLVERLADDDDLVDAFRAELRKQGAFSIEAYGKVGLAMYPFIGQSVVSETVLRLLHRFVPSDGRTYLRTPARADAGTAESQEHHKLDNDRQVFFYEQDFYVLSNFSAFNLKWRGHTFPTSEHAYHWARFAMGWDLTDAAGADAEWLAVKVKAAPSAHEAFKLAQEHKHFQHPDWNMDKIGVMRSILRAKADQHEYVRRKLLATGDRELIEDSWRDDFWGWGEGRTGLNMLGKLWMEVRTELRAAAQADYEQRILSAFEPAPARADAGTAEGEP